MEKWSLSDIRARNKVILFLNEKTVNDCFRQSQNDDSDVYRCVLMLLNLHRTRAEWWIASNLMKRYLRTYSGLYTLGSVRTLWSSEASERTH